MSPRLELSLERGAPVDPALRRTSARCCSISTAPSSTRSRTSPDRPTRSSRAWASRPIRSTPTAGSSATGWGTCSSVRSRPGSRTPDLVDRCVEGFRETYGRGWNVASRPYPGIPELLDGLVSRGLGMAVLSNKPDAFTRQCVDEYLARWPFRAVFGDREGVPRKPDPGGALACGRTARRRARRDRLPRRFVGRHDHRPPRGHDPHRRGLGVPVRG